MTLARERTSKLVPVPGNISFFNYIPLKQYTCTMRYLFILEGLFLLPTALAAAVPVDDIDPAMMDREIARLNGELEGRVDQPESPWINDNCFSPENVEEHKKDESCPKKNELKQGSQGDWYCPIKIGNNPMKCESYCEQNLSWTFGKEQPFDNASCRAGSDCSLSITQSVTITETTSFNFGISHSAFSLGASFSFSDSKSTANGISHSKPDDLKDNCGYWTFVPYMVTSCGRSAKADIHKNIINKWCANRVDGDMCVTRAYKTKSGTAGGKAIFVATDCDSNKPLPFCKQDEVFLKAGVARDEQVHLDYKASWWDGDQSKGPTGTAKYQCELGNWPMQ
ncbi:unnamed protein product [Clonostachys chloroleuca]|uniref:Uncharacterized protein n=1 Tax=Clonostachys chloroleuca TaxID=1926264 RepID=A0AA35PXU0_9HYPO|nr:unnamed protein product [Clonostachys chloroleuca]